MNSNSETPEARTADEIREWIVHRVAELMNIAPDSVDTETPFASYGLGSKEAVMLVGELEQWLQRPVSPVLLWDYPDIGSAVRHLAGETQARASVARNASDDTLTPELLSELANLSDEEAEALIKLGLRRDTGKVSDG